MTASRLDGKLCATAVEESLQSDILDCKENGVEPHLAVVIVGDDPASHVYVNNNTNALRSLLFVHGKNSIFHVYRNVPQLLSD